MQGNTNGINFSLLRGGRVGQAGDQRGGRDHELAFARGGNGGPCRNRTCNLTIRRRLLCLVELMARD